MHVLIYVVLAPGHSREPDGPLSHAVVKETKHDS